MSIVEGSKSSELCLTKLPSVPCRTGARRVEHRQTFITNTFPRTYQSPCFKIIELNDCHVISAKICRAQAPGAQLLSLLRKLSAVPQSAKIGVETLYRN
jgi:hypothetical protein